MKSIGNNGTGTYHRQINSGLLQLKILQKSMLLFLLFILSLNLASQEIKVWSLEECINYALENNINVQKQELLVSTQEEILLQSKLGILPSFNGYVSHGYNWGQRVDPFTNEFATDRVRSNNMNLQGELNLFSGLQQLNMIKQNLLDLKAAQYDVDYFQDEVAISVATQYLQTLYYIEYVTINKNQANITQQQVDRTKKLIEAGTLTKGDLLALEAQLASEKLLIVQAENNLDLSYLTLSQLLLLPTPVGFEIERPELGLFGSTGIQTPEQIFNIAVQLRPEIKSAETRLESTGKSLNIARGTYYPMLYLNAELGTGYSGNNTMDTPPYDPKPWNDQFEDNLYQVMDLSLRIPIFNGWISRSTVAQAKIDVENSMLDLKLQKNTLYQIIQLAYNDAISAANQYDAANVKVDANKKLFNYAEKKFEVGLINSIEYKNAKKDYNNALSELVQSKYDFVFRSMIVDFYQGKPLTLKR